MPHANPLSIHSPAPERENIACLYSSGGEITQVVFCPDRKYDNIVASCSTNHETRLWDIHAPDSALFVLKEYAPVYSIAFSPDGNNLASSREGSIRVWKLPLIFAMHKDWPPSNAIEFDGIN